MRNCTSEIRVFDVPRNVGHGSLKFPPVPERSLESGTLPLPGHC